MSKFSMWPVASLAIIFVFLKVHVAAQNYVVELVVVVDKPARTRWVQLAKDNTQFVNELTSTFVEVNEIFKSLKENGLELEVRVKQFLYPEEEVVASASASSVDANTAMEKARQWILAQRVEFDHAVVLTNADLTYSGRSISGYTMMQATCYKSSVSIARARYDYGTVTSLATLLAQSMAVDYDGQGQASACSSSDGYIMSSSHQSQSKNKWSFSSCSAEQIKDYIKDKGCLQSEMTSARALSGYRFGQVVGANETCSRSTGNHVVSGDGSQICTHLSCFDRKEGYTTYTLLVDTPEGLSCGPNQNKICIRGECVPQV